MARYRRTAQARQAAQQQEAQQRRQAAWEVARQAACLLRESFGATRVIAFGSLAHGAWFGPHSDLDLAAEGIPPEAFWRAWCALDHVDPTFEIDLVAIEEASERLREEVAEYGVSL
jgi:predicted nucleotidyltransferase